MRGPNFIGGAGKTCKEVTLNLTSEWLARQGVGGESKWDHHMQSP